MLLKSKALLKHRQDYHALCMLLHVHRIQREHGSPLKQAVCSNNEPYDTIGVWNTDKGEWRQIAFMSSKHCMMQDDDTKEVIETSYWNICPALICAPKPSDWTPVEIEDVDGGWNVTIDKETFPIPTDGVVPPYVHIIEVKTPNA